MELCILLNNASSTEINVVKMFQHYTLQVNMLLVFHTFQIYPNNGTPFIDYLFFNLTRKNEIESKNYNITG